MFSRLFKLLAAGAILFLAFTANADAHAHKTHAPRLAVKQLLHAEMLLEEGSAAYILISQAPLKQALSQPQCVLGLPAKLLLNPYSVLVRCVVSRNSWLPRNILLILFPFHVFW